MSQVRSDTKSVSEHRPLVPLLSDDQLKVAEVVEGAEEVDLPCTTKADLTGTIRVEWRRSVPRYIVIHDYVNGKNQPEKDYVGRTEMRENPQEKGVLTLNLKNPHLVDGGVYICTIYRNEELLRQKIVVLSVRGQFSMSKPNLEPEQ